MKFCFNWNNFETCRSNCSVCDQGVLRHVAPPATGNLLAAWRTVICWAENGSLTFGVLSPDIISIQCIQQLTSIYYFVLRIHWLLLSINIVIQGQQWDRNLERKIYYVCCILTNGYKDLWKKMSWNSVKYGAINCRNCCAL